MNRRTFATLITVGALCLGTKKLGAVAPAERDDLTPPHPSRPLAETERFAVSIDEYKSIDPEFLPQFVRYATAELPGTIVVDTDNRFLYLVLESGQAKRYGVGVGRDGFGWSGTATVGRKTKWPMWFPPKEMQYRDKESKPVARKPKPVVRKQSKQGTVAQARKRRRYAASRRDYRRKYPRSFFELIFGPRNEQN